MAKRNVSKRFELNDYEAELLKLKAARCGLKEGAYLRELITGYVPKAAPGKEFYDAMNDINKIGVNINQIAAVANSTGVIDDKWLKELAADLHTKMLELKHLVLDSEAFYPDYDSWVINEQRRAKEYGLPFPQTGHIEEARKLRKQYERELLKKGVDVDCDY